MFHSALHLADQVPGGFDEVKTVVLLLLAVDDLGEVAGGHPGPVHVHRHRDHGTVQATEISDGANGILPHLELGTFLVLWVVAVAVPIIEVEALSLVVLFLVDDPAAMEDEEAGWFLLQREAPELAVLLGQRDAVAREETGWVSSRVAAGRLRGLDTPETASVTRHHLPGPAAETLASGGRLSLL